MEQSPKVILKDVIDNKINHSKKQEYEYGEMYTKLKYKFKPNKYVTYSSAEIYEERFKSFLLYEWSKRKTAEQVTGEPFNMWVSCLVVENQYIHRYNDVFLFDQNETELIKKARGLIKILDHFYFPDVEVYFFIEDGDDRREHRRHLIEVILSMIQEDFLITYNFCSIIEEEKTEIIEVCN